ncbi:hypothetical protein AMTR_s00058p00073870 [Amborella trichopoda]|uniref:Uncharacterized protein n=1 Tax=Amborella trichopoda TaxID=13333 RepID=W1PFT9_AMBTC|nr:hypothetical protein AMTR_s00058p00073870 [Amborella trichopoda]
MEEIKDKGEARRKGRRDDDLAAVRGRGREGKRERTKATEESLEGRKTARRRLSCRLGKREVTEEKGEARRKGAARRRVSRHPGERARSRRGGENEKAAETATQGKGSGRHSGRRERR